MYRSLKHVASLLLLTLLHVDAFSQTAPVKPPAKTGYFMLLVNRIKAQAKAYQLMSSRRDGPRQGGDVIAIYHRETKTERIVFECPGCRNPLLYQGTYFYLKDSTSI